MTSQEPKPAEANGLGPDASLAEELLAKEGGKIAPVSSGAAPAADEAGQPTDTASAAEGEEGAGGADATSGAVVEHPVPEPTAPHSALLLPKGEDTGHFGPIELRPRRRASGGGSGHSSEHGNPPRKLPPSFDPSTCRTLYEPPDPAALDPPSPFDFLCPNAPLTTDNAPHDSFRRFARLFSPTLALAPCPTSRSIPMVKTSCRARAYGRRGRRRFHRKFPACFLRPENSSCSACPPPTRPSWRRAAVSGRREIPYSRVVAYRRSWSSGRCVFEGGQVVISMPLLQLFPFTNVPFSL